MFNTGDLVRSKILTIHNWGIGTVIDKITYQIINCRNLPIHQTLYRVKWSNEPKGYDENNYLPSSLYHYIETDLEKMLTVGNLVKFDEEEILGEMKACYKDSPKHLAYYAWCKGEAGDFGIGLVVDIINPNVKVYWLNTRKVKTYTGYTAGQLRKVE